MDMTTLSFCFPADDPRCASLPPETVLNACQKLCDDASERSKCHVVLGPADGKRIYTVSLSGSLQSVIAARGILLNRNPWLLTEVVKVSRYEIFKPNQELKPMVQARINEIQTMSKAQILLLNPGFPGPNSPPGLSPNGSKVIDVAFTGLHNQIDAARIQFLVLLDELAGLYVERIELDVKLHNITAGRKHCASMVIMEETMTNIYFPSSLILNSRRPTNPSEGTNNYVFITGEFASVQKAKEMLLGFANHKRKQMVSREVAILPRKLDWMLTARPDDLLAIMGDNATYIEFPPVMAQTGVMIVVGENRVDVERTVRSIMQLSCYHFAAWLWVNPPQPGGTLPASQSCTLPPQAQVLTAIAQISHTTGAEILFRNYVFEVYGLDNQVRVAYQRLSELEFVRNCHRESKFQVELANEHRDFISGKKNGKINKIMKVTNVRIKYEAFNEYNFLIDVCSSSCAYALEGLSLLQEELPAEISFFVPESYHKRIIGVGGKNIQRIMKKYGVYVKFSNAEEFAALGGYFESNDNVVARTPAKNAINLEYLKQAVMELVSPKDKDFVTEVIAIPRQHHRAVVGDQGSAIHNIETQTGTEIRFPYKETGSDFVRVTGPMQQARHACQLVSDIIPEDCEVRVPSSSTLLIAIGGIDFRENVVARLQREYNVTLLYSLPSTSNQIDGGDYLFLLRYNKGNADLLPPAREVLISFLAAHQVPSHSTIPALSTNDSFTEGTFQHFNSRLLASVAQDAIPIAHSYSSYSLFDKGAGNAFANSRAVGSAPNLRALFDNMTLGGTNHVTAPDVPNMKRSNSNMDVASRVAGLPPKNVSGSAGSIDRWNSSMSSMTPEALSSMSALSKSLPADALKEDIRNARVKGALRGGAAFQPVEFSSSDSEYSEDDLVLPNQEFIEKLVGMENSKDFNQLRLLFEELNLSKYTQLFVDQEVDFDMFLTLSGSDLEQLGIKTFGSRRKMANAIQEITANRAQQKGRSSDSKKAYTGTFVRTSPTDQASKRVPVTVSGHQQDPFLKGGVPLGTGYPLQTTDNTDVPASAVIPTVSSNLAGKPPRFALYNNAPRSVW